MMAVHEKKPLPLVAYVLNHRILAVVAALLNQDIFWCRNNSYHPFDGYLLQQAGDSYPPFDEYSSYPMYGNIFWYSLIKLYDSRQQISCFIDHLMVIFLQFLMIKFGLLLGWLIPVFSYVILGILGFPSSHSVFMNIRARRRRPF